MMDKARIHRIIDEYFSNQKHYAFDVFGIRDISVLVPYIKKGQKIPVKLRGHIKKSVEDIGISDRDVYDAFLEYLSSKFVDERQIIERIEQWKKGTLLHFV